MNQLDTIKFVRNTFRNIDLNSESGGVGIEVESEDTNNILILLFEDCTFDNTQNKNVACLGGGAIHCGNRQNTGNVHLTVKGCKFQDANHEEKGGSIYINVKNEVLIDNSAGTGASIYIKPDYTHHTTQSLITINNCNIQQNEATQSGSVFIESGSTKTISINYCTFDNFPKDMAVKGTTLQQTIKEPALTITQIKGVFKDDVIIDECIFDSCLGEQNKAFYILVEKILISISYTAL
ncbi:hypothetical protein M9Y10_012438 [Tritrichomonas musculus]|uniref:Right handed beta helix domain-containing protein n=1 Tax=Tritrichomonas musculus TaxID=1915356 RepID=A0ABR2IE69_9EUKA